uniref:MARVEL domain-containing protein n=1 Tax=Aotus nancymaae TaxID=37293 RepID=A0A2K5D5H4_AOTNA
EFPSKVSTGTSSPAQGAGAALSALSRDLGFLCSRHGALLLLQLVLGATVLYVTAFIACFAAVDLTSLKGTQPYNQHAAAWFFASSAFFSYQACQGVGSNAATSQMAGGYA